MDLMELKCTYSEFLSMFDLVELKGDVNDQRYKELIDAITDECECNSYDVHFAISIEEVLLKVVTIMSLHPDTCFDIDNETKRCDVRTNFSVVPECLLIFIGENKPIGELITDMDKSKTKLHYKPKPTVAIIENKDYFPSFILRDLVNYMDEYEPVWHARFTNMVRKAIVEITNKKQ